MPDHSERPAALPPDRAHWLAVDVVTVAQGAPFEAAVRAVADQLRREIIRAHVIHAREQLARGQVVRLAEVLAWRADRELGAAHVSSPESSPSAAPSATAAPAAAAPPPLPALRRLFSWKKP